MAGIAVLKDSCRMYLGEDKTVDVDRPLVLKDKVTSITTIGEVGAEAEDIDTTALDSMAKESEPGFDDWGSVSVEQNITKDEYSKMNAWRKGKNTLKFGIIAENKEKKPVLSLSGKCFIKSCKWGGATVGGLLTCTSDIRFTGEILDTFVEPKA